MNLGKPAAYDQNFQLTERRVMKSYSGWGGRDKGPALRGLTEILETTFLIIDNNFFFFFRTKKLFIDFKSHFPYLQCTYTKRNAKSSTTQTDCPVVYTFE